MGNFTQISFELKWVIIEVSMNVFFAYLLFDIGTNYLLISVDRHQLSIFGEAPLLPAIN
jgi:hypothetical protein